MSTNVATTPPMLQRWTIPSHIPRVPFTAPCPACGGDCEWVAVRKDTVTEYVLGRQCRC